MTTATAPTTDRLYALAAIRQYVDIDEAIASSASPAGRFIDDVVNELISRTGKGYDVHCIRIDRIMRTFGYRTTCAGCETLDVPAAEPGDYAPYCPSCLSDAYTIKL